MNAESRTGFEPAARKEHSTSSEPGELSSAERATIRERTGMIWAQTRNAVIGNQGEMPWHVPEDLQHFQRTTAHSVVVMGRKTWESLGQKYRPLPQRINMVLSRDPETAQRISAEGGVVVEDLQQALALAAQRSGPETMIWIMGGGAVYAEAVQQDLAATAVITLIDTEAAGDAYAPSLPEELWGSEPAQSQAWTRSRSGVDFQIQTWRRHRPQLKD